MSTGEMVEVAVAPEETESSSVVTKSTEPKKVGELFGDFVLEGVAIITWIYTIIKIFIYDIDRWAVSQYVSSYSWILDYKFIILLGVIALFWKSFGNKISLKWFLYIFFYPAILLFKIGWFVFKQKSWTLFFAIVNGIISFFKSFKFNFIVTAILLVTFACVINFDNPLLLSISCIVLGCLLVISYVRQFWLALRPSGIFQLYIKVFTKAREIAPKSFEPDETIKDLMVTEMNENQLQKWTTTLQTSVLFNRICLFSARKLRNYQNSGLQFIPSIFSILSLVIFTVVSFTGIYFSLFKLNNNLYSFTEPPAFFTFFYYSSSNLFFNGIPDLVAIMPLSQFISMLEWFSALVLLGIFVTVVLSVKSERNSAEMGEVIQSIEQQGQEMEGFIRETYKLNNIQEAMEELQRLKAGLVSLMYKMSQGL